MARQQRPVKKRLWDVFSLYIRERDNYICFTCGINKEVAKLRDMCMQAGHLITRKNTSTLYDDLNTHCQCSGCNMAHEFHPEVYTTAFIKKYGVEAYERLVIKSKMTLKLSKADMEAMIVYYKQQIERIRHERESEQGIEVKGFYDGLRESNSEV